MKRCFMFQWGTRGGGGGGWFFSFRRASFLSGDISFDGGGGVRKKLQDGGVASPHASPPHYGKPCTMHPITLFSFKSSYIFNKSQ